MKSAVPKVLHKIAGLPMVSHVVKAVRAAGVDQVVLVAGRGGEDIRAAAEPFAPGSELFLQPAPLGTAHAVLVAREAIARGFDDILVVYGDTPLVEPDALAELRAGLAAGAAVSVMGFRPDNPTGYGRLIEQGNEIVAIREERDCSTEERKVGFCNAGLMAIAGEHALALLDEVGNDNAKGEYYLTDIVEIARARGLRVVATEASHENAMGINNRTELAQAEAIWQQRKRRQMMLSGVTLLAPETVFFSHDTEIGPDTILEPNIFFGPGVTIASNVIIHAFSHIEGASVSEGAEVGPFARLRPGAELKEKAKVGNFCEVKKAVIEPGAKVNHLTYIGDAVVGAKANIGAGTITCNYDGYNKHLTEIGAGAFIGSNSALVAPVRIGDGAYVASGSVITEEVPADALAFGRARQTTLPGRAAELRQRYSAAKKE